VSWQESSTIFTVTAVRLLPHFGQTTDWTGSLPRATTLSFPVDTLRSPPGAFTSHFRRFEPAHRLPVQDPFAQALGAPATH
jgi:hypothetical protein